MMCTETCCRIKALLLIGVLVGAEVQKVEQDVRHGFGYGSRSDRTTGSAAERDVSSYAHKSETEAILAEHGLMASPSLQQQVHDLTQHITNMMEVAKASTNYQHAAHDASAASSILAIGDAGYTPPSARARRLATIPSHGLRPFSSNSFPAATKRSVTTRGPKVRLYSASGAIEGVPFTEEERKFFQSREEPKPSRRERAVEAGLGSLALVLGTALSLTLANGPWSKAYIGFWEKVVGVGPAAWHLQLPLREWINEAAMAFFFFAVGLEIKKEFLFGSLSSPKQAALPCVGALGGMVAPAACYCIVQKLAGCSLQGWAIPMATDIAFAMGVYNIFKSRFPAAMSAFLLTLATVDDLGAIGVIAVFFGHHMKYTFLVGAALVGVVLEAFRRKKVRSTKAYLTAGIALWYCLLRGGVNADIAGVATSFAIPAVAAPKHTNAPQKFPDKLDHYIHFWLGWTSFVIMPLFAIANTAIPLSCGLMAVATSPQAQGIMAGLLIGKPLGIAGASLLALKLGWCTWPTGLKPIHLALSGLLGGIAFTMSLFLIEQSFFGAAAIIPTIAVVVGSTLAATLAAGITVARMPPLTSESAVLDSSASTNSSKPEDR